MTPTKTEKREALKWALRKLPDEGHHGAPHVTGRFRYHPMSCPGCARAILETMLRSHAT